MYLDHEDLNPLGFALAHQIQFHSPSHDQEELFFQLHQSDWKALSFRVPDPGITLSRASPTTLSVLLPYQMELETNPSDFPTPFLHNNLLFQQTSLL
ncbi:hypothetical protein YC2023_033293 [Brassica napus]